MNNLHRRLKHCSSNLWPMVQELNPSVTFVLVRSLVHLNRELVKTGEAQMKPHFSSSLGPSWILLGLRLPEVMVMPLCKKRSSSCDDRNLSASSQAQSSMCCAIHHLGLDPDISLQCDWQIMRFVSELCHISSLHYKGNVCVGFV